MQKTIQIKITAQGHARGTVGWLADHAAEIHLGRTKDGCEGAWLCDANGKTITALAIRGYWGGDGMAAEYNTAITTISRDPAGRGLGADIGWTDAGWDAVSRLAEAAVEAIEAKLAKDDDHEAPAAAVVETAEVAS